MKKILCAFLALIFIFSFAGCSDSGRQNIKNDAPKISDMKLNEKYKSKDGTISFMIKGRVPEIGKGCDEFIASLINRIIGEYVDEFKAFAESNAENARNFMEMNNSENPWMRTFDYEVTYADSNIVCLLIKNGMTLDGGNPSVSYKTFCFELKDGRGLSAVDFSVESEEPLREDMTRFVLNDLNEKFYGSSEKLSAEQAEKVSSLIDFWNYYIDEENVYFYFPKAGIDSSLSGYYICTLPHEKVFNYFVKPSEFLSLNEEK